MKRHTVIALLSGLLVAALILASGAVAVALTGSPGNGGAMSGSRWTGFGMMRSAQQRTASGSALTIDQAQHQVNRYIKQYGNSHLVIDEIIEFQQNFYAIVKDTSTHHGAFEVLVNKWTGLVFPEYGPAMMWNTDYGMIRGRTTGGGMMPYWYPRGPMTVSAVYAAIIARRWVAQYHPGTTIQVPDQLPGYYTVHLRAGNRIDGMLSVNGFTGRVWYHTWHGAFIRVKVVHG